MSGAPKSSSGRVVPRPSDQRGAFEHHGPGIAARHPKVRRVGAGVHPGALVQRPAVLRALRGLPALHLDDPVIHVEMQRADEPPRELAHGESVTHRKRTGADETLPARAQAQPFHGSPDRIRPVEHPHALVHPGRLFQHVAQRGDERVDAAAQVLQIDQQHVEAVHHGGGGTAHLAVQAEHRNAVLGVVVVRRFDHVVLLVAAQAVLGTEGGDDAKIANSRERIERVREIARHRCRVSEQRDAAAGQRLAQRRLFQETIKAESHRVLLANPVLTWRLAAKAERTLLFACGSIPRQCKGETVRMMEVGLAGRMRERPV